MLNFFSRHEIICEQQCNFMKNSSTNISSTNKYIAKLLKKIVWCKEDGIVRFLRSSKSLRFGWSFIFLRKSIYYGIRGYLKQRIRHFLANVVVSVYRGFSLCYILIPHVLDRSLFDLVGRKKQNTIKLCWHIILLKSRVNTCIYIFG